MTRGFNLDYVQMLIEADKFKPLYEIKEGEDQMTVARILDTPPSGMRPREWKCIEGPSIQDQYSVHIIFQYPPRDFHDAILTLIEESKLIQKRISSRRFAEWATSSGEEIRICINSSNPYNAAQIDLF